MKFADTFDVIVVGGGHAGTEAALASARMGVRTLLLTQSIETLGQLSCNPSIGGIGKSQLVKEIDALGGAMAYAADQASIHWRLLNASKGPAVRATRVQVDRQLYKKAIRSLLETQEQLQIFEQPVVDLILKEDTVVGVITQLGLRFAAKAIVLTAGTFLNGKIHVGKNHYTGGRMGEAASISLASRLQVLPFRMGRLKTGTPPRIDGRTIEYQNLQEQPSDFPLPLLSWRAAKDQIPSQKSCFMTRTTEDAHTLILNNLTASPLYAGDIQGIGPRYCPSIEDKVVRFSHRSSHQIMLEPESLQTGEVYPNGLSTSLPFDVQIKLVHSLPGLEKAHITRPGYAIEYDFFDPRDLSLSLESQVISELFCAGQINGTTGYEEAAAQGLIAGLNAALKVQNRSTWYPRRDQAYLGVLIDDLVTRGTLEPYRMFTSRAEYRLLLREDNADLRLTQIGFQLGLVSTLQWSQVANKSQILDAEKEKLNKTYIRPDTPAAEKINPFLQHPITSPVSLMRLLMQPKIQYRTLMELPEIELKIHDPSIQDQIKVQAHYSGYIERQEEEIAKQIRYDTKSLPQNFDYHNIKGLSNEVREILLQHQPKTVGQALRLSGMTRAAISILLIYLKRRETGS